HFCQKESVAKKAGIEASLYVEGRWELLLDQSKALLACRQSTPGAMGGLAQGEVLCGRDRLLVTEFPVAPDPRIQVLLFQQPHSRVFEMPAITSRCFQARNSPIAHEGMKNHLFLKGVEPFPLAPGLLQESAPRLQHANVSLHGIGHIR